jgi:hypothetical protein
MIDRALPILLKHRLVYLSMETRTGKTPVSIMLSQRLCESNGVKQAVFCTKKSVIPAIQKTLSELKQDNRIDIDIQIVSFDSLHKVDHAPNRIIIADEAHSFGAYPKPSRRAVMLAGLSRQCYVIFLSATPTPESFSQIYHQLWAARSESPLIAPYKNFYAWARDYVQKKEVRYTNEFGVVETKLVYYTKRTSGGDINDYSRAKKELILPYLDELSVSGTKADAGFQHTSVKEIFVDAPMPDSLVQQIKAIKRDNIITIDGDEIVADTAAALLSKVHQLSSGTVIGRDKTHMVADHKLSRLRMIQIAYPKIAIYYKYIGEYEALKAYFGGRATDNANEFNESPDKVFLGQFLSKREGINLMEADALVMYNIDFAYLSYEQTINRITNMNRKTLPVVIWIFSQYTNDKGKPESLERRIYNDVKQKKNYTLAHYKRQERMLW